MQNSINIQSHRNKTLTDYDNDNDNEIYIRFVPMIMIMEI